MTPDAGARSRTRAWLGIPLVLALAAPASAQDAAIPTPPPFERWHPGVEALRLRTEAPAPRPADDRTRGLIIGGAIGAVVGGTLGYAVAGLDESDPSPVGAIIGGAILGGLIGMVIGGNRSVF